MDGRFLLAIAAHAALIVMVTLLGKFIFWLFDLDFVNVKESELMIKSGKRLMEVDHGSLQPKEYPDGSHELTSLMPEERKPSDF